MGLLFPPTSAEYIVTNDISHQSTDEVELEIQTRWKIEEFHARIKQRSRARVLPVP
ncbi:hypothetical protein [Dapis sp. BLCC M172]|uniref:hypothetical protein n=1 Tax=Dapis sp. BLCC M172 TaxID=2975281 RepID=UPI003CF189DF